MCGIFLSSTAPVPAAHSRLLYRRGIDSYMEREYQGVTVASSVLAIRNHVFQPVLGNDYLLQFNGEIYNHSDSDTLFISEVIDETIQDYTLGISITRNLDDIPKGIQRLHLKENYIRPFFLHSENDFPLDAMAVSHLFDFAESVYVGLNKFENEAAVCIYSNRKAFFFKDDIGKRSLGISRLPFTISSLLYDEEIDPLKLYFYDFEHKVLLSRFKPANRYIQRILDNVPAIMPFFKRPKYSGMYAYLTGYDAYYAEDIMDSDEVVYQLENSTDIEMTDMLAEQGMEKRGEIIRVFIEAFQESVSKRLFGNNHVVFFSGGVDSTIVALFVHLTAPKEDSIYLINTAYPDSFDRKIGVQSHAALSGRFPERTFILVKEELSDKLIREETRHIKELLYPKEGIMQLCIATVQYFSALRASEYSRVALIGSGADEAFCGYKKYRAGPKVDRNHMLFSLMTMSSHNVGRDDRIIADCAVEARFPFLDLQVLETAFLLSDNWLVNKEGENKHLLREVLRHYGLHSVADIPKKAMQFGSGISQREGDIWDLAP